MASADDEYRSGPDPVPLADEWHARHHGDGEVLSPCWCCCLRCDPDYGGMNPHFIAAQERLEADLTP